MSAGKEKKAKYIEKFSDLLQAHSKVLIVSCDNIGSSHMQKIRTALRGYGTLCLGKNTLMRKAIRNGLPQHPEWEALYTQIKGNIGLCFCAASLHKCKEIVLASRVPAVAKAGIIAPQAVTITKGPTTLEPTKTSFLQALNIATKINKGAIEILTDVYLLKEGDKVGSSEATLLSMLNIKPFTYGLVVRGVYDEGVCYGLNILDMPESEILERFTVGIGQLAAFSLGINIPTAASFPHVVVGAYRNLLAVVVATGYTFPQAAKVKEMAENPDAFVSTTTTTTTTTATTAAPVVEETGPVEEEEPEEDMGFDLFG